MKREERNRYIALALAAVLAAAAFTIYRIEKRSGETYSPKPPQLTEEEVIKSLTAPTSDKPYKPDPNLIKKLSVPAS